jgi:protein gp37
MSTKIAWTDEVWNPTVGCAPVSEGCRNCYAARMAHRGMTAEHRGLTTATQRWNGLVRLLPERLDQPFHWRKPRRIFVDSMSDLFHPDVPESFLIHAFMNMDIAAKKHGHVFQVLTKRAKRMRAFMCRYHDSPMVDNPRIWLGISAENQKTADERIRELVRTPCSMRFLSLEPLLGEIDLPRFLGDRNSMDGCDATGRAISWVIVGGESGPDARKCQVGWVRDLVQQCRWAEVPVFVKQLGSVVSWHGSEPEEWPRTAKLSPGYRIKLSDRKGAVLEDWPEDLRVQQFPEVEVDPSYEPLPGGFVPAAKR